MNEETRVVINAAMGKATISIPNASLRTWVFIAAIDPSLSANNRDRDGLTREAHRRPSIDETDIDICRLFLTQVQLASSSQNIRLRVPCEILPGHIANHSKETPTERVR